MIIEKIATSLNMDNFFSNKRILAIFCRFAVLIAHTTGFEPKKKCTKAAIIHSTKKPILN